VTLADKRKVIEVLMCTGDPNKLLLFEVASALGRSSAPGYRALDAVQFDSDNYTGRCLEAAYRLIESSPTLRGEWFGSQ